MTDALRHGFKANAERIALSIRRELRIPVSDRLSCFELARHLCIPIKTLIDLQREGASIQSIRHLMDAKTKFSALTVCAGTRRLIVYNAAEPPGRQANSLAHELSHAILEHPPAPALGKGGCRQWNPQYEAEADWLAGALLVPRDGVFARLAAGDTLLAGADHFGVSLPLFRWRANQTGVLRQLKAMGHRLNSVRN